MINNNRQAGRRRGRGGQQQRSPGNPGRQDNGSRIDNRARGNASQLHEKYKSLAADAQRQGDRVNTEYYLQFADHYFRVLSETRSRFEEQNQQRRGQGDGYDDDGDGYDDDLSPPEMQRAEPDPRDNRRERSVNPGGNGTQNGNGYAARDDRHGSVGDYSRGDELQAPMISPDDEIVAAEPGEAPRRRGRPRRERPQEDAVEAIDADRLPPSLGFAGVPGIEGEMDGEAPKPRRRRARAADEAPPAS